jgi:ferredoxin
VCAGEAPEIFGIGDNGKVELVGGEQDIPSELHEKVRAAEAFCPTRAIRVVEQ